MTEELTPPAQPAAADRLLGELRRLRRVVSGSLLIVALLQAALGPVALVAMTAYAQRQADSPLPTPWRAIAVSFAFAGGMFGAWLWSRVDPFPAAVMGLTIYLSIHATDAITGGADALLRGGLLKVVVLVVLARTVQLAARYRNILRRHGR